MSASAASVDRALESVPFPVSLSSEHSRRTRSGRETAHLLSWFMLETVVRIWKVTGCRAHATQAQLNCCGGCRRAMGSQRNQERVRNDLIVALSQAPHLSAAADEFCKPKELCFWRPGAAGQALLAELIGKPFVLVLWS